VNGAPPRARAPQLLWIAASIVALVAGALTFRQVAAASAARLPLDLVTDRLGGAMVDHAIRVRDGLPTYCEPDDRFMPVVYTPLYYHLAAATMRVVADPLVACRATALGLVTLAALALALFAWRTTRSAWAGASVLLLAAAGDRACEFFYDAPRTDPAAALFAALAVVAAATFTRPRSGLVVGALLCLAFWGKQSTALFSAAFCALLLLENWRRALVAGATFGALTAASVWAENVATGGWFWRQAIALTSEHDLPFERLKETLAQDWLGPLLPSLIGVALVALALFTGRRSSPSPVDAAAPTEADAPAAAPGRDARRRLVILFLGAVAMALFTTVSRTRTGATAKILIPIVLLLAALLPMGAWWIEARCAGAPRGRLLGALARLGVAAVLALAWFPVERALPTAEQEARWKELLAVVDSHAAKGQVWLSPWGYVTTRIPGQSMRPTMLALEDWLGVRGKSTGNAPPPKLVAAIERGEFAAILFPSRGKNRWFRPEIDRAYRLERELEPMTVGVEDNELRLGVFVPKVKR
jgi:hypothetical protein